MGSSCPQHPKRRSAKNPECTMMKTIFTDKDSTEFRSDGRGATYRTSNATSSCQKPHRGRCLSTSHKGQGQSQRTGYLNECRLSLKRLKWTRSGMSSNPPFKKQTQRSIKKRSMGLENETRPALTFILSTQSYRA